MNIKLMRRFFFLANLYLRRTNQRATVRDKIDFCHLIYEPTCTTITVKVRYGNSHHVEKVTSHPLTNSFFFLCRLTPCCN